VKPPASSIAKERMSAAEISPDDAALIATWPGDRPGILRLLQCRLLHRADWQYLGTRHDESIAPWPVDAYRCERCERAWDSVR
jgi:hypothetical protein